MENAHGLKTERFGLSLSKASVGLKRGKVLRAYRALLCNAILSVSLFSNFGEACHE